MLVFIEYSLLKVCVAAAIQKMDSLIYNGRISMTMDDGVTKQNIIMVDVDLIRAIAPGVVSSIN